MEVLACGVPGVPSLRGRSLASAAEFVAWKVRGVSSEGNLIHLA